MGKLYIVSTPIGNLSDVSQRALETLSKVDTIVCEDTRRTGNLLQNLHLPKKPLLSLTDFNELQKVIPILSQLKSGKDIALVSDAGTPLLSDPGYILLKAVISDGIPTEVIPGPSAAVSAAQVSGLPLDRILFWGFLPKKDNDKRRVFEKIIKISEVEPTTFVFFESPHRLRKTLTLLNEVVPLSTLALTRELTKLYQEIKRGSPQEILATLPQQILGEVALVIRLNINPER